MTTEDKIARISAAWYLGISAGLALIFYAAATLKNYPAAACFGGAVWVFILTMIITMPVVIPQVKKRYR